jgi:hypothetical protein
MLQHMSLPASVGVNLAGADLSRQRIENATLLGADLCGANLHGALIRRVDLRLCNLRGANLSGATLEMVDMTGADLRGIVAEHARLRHVDLLDADLTGSDLRRSIIHGCSLERGILEDCDLTRAYLVRSSCDNVRLARARLDGLTTLSSTFRGADLAGAHRFFACPELVAEILLREANGQLTRIMECAAIVVDRERCYSEWQEYVAANPEASEFAYGVFAKYPESGCTEALRGGWKRQTCT